MDVCNSNTNYIRCWYISDRTVAIMSDETWNELCFLVRRYGEEKAKEMIEAMDKYLSEVNK